MYTAAIFDLNGIFIQSPKLSDRFQKDFNIPTTTFLPKLSEIMDKVRQPNAGPSFQYWQPVLEEWGIHLSETEFWDYWFSAETQSEDMIVLAKELRAKGILVFVLSNNFKERADYYGHYPWIHEALDGAYFSWQTGFVKPDPKAWEAILTRHNLTAEECVYFDDQEKNVLAAKTVGINSFLFEGVEQVRSIVNG